MIENDPLERFRQQWLAERPPKEIRLAELQAEASRRRRRLVLLVLGEAALTIVLILITLSILRTDEPPAADVTALLAVLWLTWAAAVVFAIWNRRDVWAAQAGQSYIEQVTRFARMRVRTAIFVLLATIALLVVSVGLGRTTPPVVGLAALYLAWASWYGVRARRDLARFRRIAADFQDEGGGV